jgi:hypothetical protein
MTTVRIKEICERCGYEWVVVDEDYGTVKIDGKGNIWRTLCSRCRQLLIEWIESDPEIAQARRDCEDALHLLPPEDEQMETNPWAVSIHRLVSKDFSTADLIVERVAERILARFAQERARIYRARQPAKAKKAKRGG